MRNNREGLSVSQWLSILFTVLLVAVPASGLDGTVDAPDCGSCLSESGVPAESQVEQAATESGVNDRPQLLDSHETAELAARAEEPGGEVVGGALTTQQLTYIVIALAAAVIVLIAK